jgi:ATP-dependent 26S proteasome regulatory subunit
MDIEKEIFDEAQDALPEEFLHMSVDAINQRARLLENEIRVLKDEATRLNLEQNNMKEKIKENKEKIKLNNQLPYLVGNIVEVLEHSPEDEEEEDGAAADVDAQRKGKCVVLKTSTRQTIFLPVVGLVDANTLKPGDLVGVNKDSYLVLDTLPAEYDSRVKAMEVDEKPTEDYSDIGGLDKQIQELVEAIVLPIKHKDRFIKLGIKPPKGVLMYGPPGTGKTLMARAVAAQTNATFLKLAGPQLVQMFIGDGAKMVRDAFALAKEKSPCIIFIDEIDAIGTKRFDSELSGDREVRGCGCGGVAAAAAAVAQGRQPGCRRWGGAAVPRGRGRRRAQQPRQRAARGSSSRRAPAGAAQSQVAGEPVLRSDPPARRSRPQPPRQAPRPTPRHPAAGAGADPPPCPPPPRPCCPQVQRTMLELLNQLDGFSSSDDIKIIAATNRCAARGPAVALAEPVGSGPGEQERRQAASQAGRGAACPAEHAGCRQRSWRGAAGRPQSTLGPALGRLRPAPPPAPRPHLTITTTSPPPPAGPTSWTRRSCALAAWTARSSSRTPARTRAPRSCASTRAR